MSLIGAKFICLDEKGKHCKVIEAKGRKFTIGYYMSCDHILVDESSKGFHCEINCDAFGRVTIHNMSEEHPVSVNDKPIIIKRPLLSGSKITILGKNYLWDFPRVTSSEYEDLNAATMSTPEKQIGIPEQPPNSCPDLKLHRDVQRRFTVHNFAYCIQFDDEGNTSNDFSQADETTVQSGLADGNEIKLVPVMEETATEERCVTPEAQNNDLLIDNNEETPKMNLINCTQNKENASTEKKMKLLSLCQQSDVVVTSFSPRETGVRIEKSFTAILKPTTPKSVYSTPKSVLSELNDEGSKDFMEFSTPATSQKTLNHRVNISSMHLIDLTTPSKMRAGSPNPKYMVKSSSSRNTLVTNSDKKKKFESVLKDCGVSPLGTPVVGDDKKTFDTPDSVISVDSTDSSESVLEISVKEPSAIKTPTKVAGTSKIITPKRTPQSLMKRALLTSAKKQLQTGNTIATTPFRSLVQTTPSVSRKIGSNLSPTTPKSTLTQSKISRRPNLSTPINRSILVKGSPDVSVASGSSTSDSYVVRRSSLFSGDSSRLPTSTPVQRSRAELRTSAKTSPLRKVRRSVSGSTLSSRISKNRTSLAVLSRMSPKGSTSSAIASAKLKRKSLHYLSPTNTRARAMLAAATPSSILKDPQTSRKANERKIVLFSEKTKSLESEDLNSTFTLETDDKSELEVIEATAKDATFSPVKTINENSGPNLDDIPVTLQMQNAYEKNETINQEKGISNVEDETESANKSQCEENNEKAEEENILGPTAKDTTFSPAKVKELREEENSIEIIEVLNEEKANENVKNKSQVGNSINEIETEEIESDAISLPVKEILINSSRNCSQEKDDNKNIEIEIIEDENELSKNEDIKENAENENGTLLSVTITEKMISSSDPHILSDKNVIEAKKPDVGDVNEVEDCYIQEKKEIDVDCSNTVKKEHDVIDNISRENISFKLVEPTEEAPGVVGGNENVETKNEIKNNSNENQDDNGVLDNKNNSTTETNEPTNESSRDTYESDDQNTDKSCPVKDYENNDDLLEQIEEVLNKSDELKKHLEFAVEVNADIMSTDLVDKKNVIKDIKETTVAPTLEYKDDTKQTLNSTVAEKVSEALQTVEDEIDIKIKSADALQMKDIEQNISSISKLDEPVVSTSIVTLEMIGDKNSIDKCENSTKLQEFDLLSSKLASLDDNNEPRTPNLKGIKELLKTPKRQKILKTPNFIGVRNLMRTPKTLNSDESEELLGVEALLKTPGVDIMEENKDILKMVVTPSPSFTPRRSARRASMSAETCRACITPLTPKRITKRRSSISIDTEIAVLTPKQSTTPQVKRKPIFEDSTVEDMGVIIEEMTSTVTTEKENKTQDAQEVLEKSECNISVNQNVVVDNGVSQTGILIEEDTCEILKNLECQETSLIEDAVSTNKEVGGNALEKPENSLASNVLEIQNSSGSSKSGKKSISEADLINVNEPLGEIMDHSEYDYGKEVKDVNDDCTINETVEATTPKTSKKEKSVYKMAKTFERNKVDVKKEIHKTPKSIKFEDVLEEDKPSTSGDSKCNLIGLQLKTPKGCSTPHTKISSTGCLDGLKEAIDTSDTITQKISTTAYENVLPETETLNFTLDNTDFNQTEDEGLDKFFRTPRAKNIMVLTSPKSVNVKKSVDSVELIHSTEYDLNTTNVENLEDIFKTPVAATRFVDDDEIVNLTEDSNGDDSDKKTDAEINERELSAEEAFDELVGLPSSNQTPARKSYTRKSLVKSLQNSPFTASDVISDLPKTDIQEWVDSLEIVESPSDSELETSDIQVQGKEEGGDKEITMVENDNDNDISRDPLAVSIIKSSESIVKRIVHDSLKGNTATSESMINISASSSMIDPLSCSAVLVDDKNSSLLRRLSPVDESLNEKIASPEETEISGINMLDQTDECVSVFSEPLLVSDTDSNVEAENTTKPLIMDNKQTEFQHFIEKPQLGLGQRSATPNNIKLQTNPLRRSLDVKSDITVTINFESEKLKTIEERCEQNIQKTVCVKEQTIEDESIQQKEKIASSDKELVKRRDQIDYTQDANIDSQASGNDIMLATLESQNAPTQTTTEEIQHKGDYSTSKKLQTVMPESECFEAYRIGNEEKSCQIVPGNIALENKVVRELQYPIGVDESKLLSNETIADDDKRNDDTSNDNASEDNKESYTENVTSNKTSDDKISMRYKCDNDSDLDEKTTQPLLVSEKNTSNIAATNSIGMEHNFVEEESINTAVDNSEANVCKDETINTDEKEIPVELIENQEITNLIVDKSESSIKECSNQNEETGDISPASFAENSFADLEETVSTQSSMAVNERIKEIAPPIMEKQEILVELIENQEITNLIVDKSESSIKECSNQNEETGDTPSASFAENSFADIEATVSTQFSMAENDRIEEIAPPIMEKQVTLYSEDIMSTDNIENPADIELATLRKKTPEEEKSKGTQSLNTSNIETSPKVEKQNKENDFICGEQNEKTSDVSEMKKIQLEHNIEEEKTVRTADTNIDCLVESTEISNILEDLQRNVEITFAENETSKTLSVRISHGSGQAVVEEKKPQASHPKIENSTEHSNVLEETKDPIPCISSEKLNKTGKSNIAEEENMFLNAAEPPTNSEDANKNTENDLGFLQSQKNNEEKALSKRTLRKGSKDSQHSLKDEEPPKLRGRKGSKDSQPSANDDAPPKRRGRKGSNDSQQHSLKDEEIAKQRCTSKKVELTIEKIDEESTNILEKQSSENCASLPSVENTSSEQAPVTHSESLTHDKILIHLQDCKGSDLGALDIKELELSDKQSVEEPLIETRIVLENIGLEQANNVLCDSIQYLVPQIQDNSQLIQSTETTEIELKTRRGGRKKLGEETLNLKEPEGRPKRRGQKGKAEYTQNHDNSEAVDSSSTTKRNYEEENTNASEEVGQTVNETDKVATKGEDDSKRTNKQMLLSEENSCGDEKTGGSDEKQNSPKTVKITPSRKGSRQRKQDVKKDENVEKSVKIIAEQETEIDLVKTTNLTTEAATEPIGKKESTKTEQVINTKTRQRGRKRKESFSQVETENKTENHEAEVIIDNETVQTISSRSRRRKVSDTDHKAVTKTENDDIEPHTGEEPLVEKVISRGRKPKVLGTDHKTQTDHKVITTTQEHDTEAHSDQEPLVEKVILRGRRPKVLRGDQKTQTDLKAVTNTADHDTEEHSDGEPLVEKVTSRGRRARVVRTDPKAQTDHKVVRKTEDHGTEAHCDEELLVEKDISRNRRAKVLRADHKSQSDHNAVTNTEDHDNEPHSDEEPLVEKVVPRGRRPKALGTDHKTQTDHKSVTKTEELDTEVHTVEEPLVEKFISKGRRQKALRTDHEIMTAKEIELVKSTKSIDTKQMSSKVEEHALKAEAKNNKLRGRNRKVSHTEDETLPKTDDNETEVPAKDQAVKASKKRKDAQKTEELTDDHETEISKTSKSRERKGKNQSSGLESAEIEEQETEKKTSRSRTRKRIDSQADHQATLDKDVELSAKKIGKKNSATAQISESPQQNVVSRRMRKATAVDNIEEESTPIKQTRGRGGRKVATVTNENMTTPQELKQEDIPHQAAAALRRTRKASTFDEHEKETLATPKATRGRSTRKEVSMSRSINEDDNQKVDSQVNSPLPENITKNNTSDEGEILTTSRGRMRKPTARAQQFLEEERAKASTPKKRVLLQSAGVDSPTPQKLPARRGRKPSTIESETPQQARKDEVTITESTSEQSHSEFDQSSEPGNILKEKESTNNIRKRGRKPKDKDEDEPVEKVVAKELTTTDSSKRITSRRGRFVETIKKPENDDSTEPKEDLKSTKNRGRGKSQNVEKISNRDRRLESATTVDDESDEDEKIDAVQIDKETPSTSTTAKKRNAAGKKDDSPTVKRGRRKALMEEDALEVNTTSAKARNTGRPRKVVAQITSASQDEVKEEDALEVSPTPTKARNVGRPRKVIAQVTSGSQVEVKEQEENAPKRTTRAIRKK